jgi:hypothetical protein
MSQTRAGYNASAVVPTEPVIQLAGRAGKNQLESGH